MPSTIQCQKPEPVENLVPRHHLAIGDVIAAQVERWDVRVEIVRERRTVRHGFDLLVEAGWVYSFWTGPTLSVSTAAGPPGSRCRARTRPVKFGMIGSI